MNYNNQLNSIPTPCYLVDEKALGKNLEIIKKLKQETNCQVILALKGFSTFATFPQLKLFLDGVTASSIYEARLGLEEFNNEVHVHSIGMNKEECHQFNTIGTKISFNSIAQFEQFKNHVTQINPSLGLRINPQLGTAPTEKYDPCAPHSRLGIPIELFSSDYFNQIEGLHFHALCEQNANSLIKILEKIELKFGNNLHKLKWMNWGGGHLITSHEYDLELLIKTINYWQKKYDLQVILEPGDAIARNTGYYVTSILDIVNNKKETAICDLSITGHMPDVLEYPYRPDILNGGKENENKYNYFIGGNTCLAGDVIGPYSFNKKLTIGEKLIFLDMGHYTIVKTSNFNGIKQPSIGIINIHKKIKIIKRSCYFNFKDRLS